jgi:hypothetical protein
MVVPQTTALTTWLRSPSVTEYSIRSPQPSTQNGEPGGIQVTEATYARIKDAYVLESRGTVAIKGKGDMNTYWLIRKQSSAV